MISVSDEWKENFYEYRTHLQIRAILTIASGTVYYLDYEDGDDDFIELALADATSSESSFDVGNFVLNTCTFKLNNSDRRWKNIILENAKLEPYIGMALESGDVEWVKKGTFYVTDTGKRGSRISLTAYDNTNAFETSFSGVSITYPITLANFVQTICDYAGITLATTTFPNSTYSISTAPNTSSTDYTCRQMISYAAMLAGCYARCNVDGELELKWYDSTTNIHTIPAYSSLENNEKDTEITGVKVVAMASENVDSSTDDEDSSESTSDEYTYGSDDDYLITIQENPLIPYGSAETVAKLIGAQIVGTTFRSSEISTLYDPSMEAGDTIQTENEDGDTITFYAANISVTLGSYATIKCSSDEDNSSSGSTSVLSYIMGQAADLVNAKFENFITKNLSAEVANIGFLKADELEAELATIGYLTAEEIEAAYIKADELEATVATFGYLTADELEALIGNFGYLTAESATITALNSEVANITSILSGNIGTGTLQSIHITSDNVVFDEAVINDAAIVSLTADKITSGTIYTDLVTIQSNADDTSLWINGSVIQMSDGSTVRVQLGKDASGTYNFYIWDADGNLMWDALGVTAEGLNDGIIVDANIADNANINESKIDMQSVAERLNEDGSITVDYANIKVGDTTLDYALTTITNNADAAAKEAEAANAAAAEAQATANQAQADAAQAASDAAAAQSTADAAATAASDAQSVADTAKANAATAQTAADDAQATADAAAEAAANAQTYAEQVQRDAASSLSEYAESVSTTLDGLQAQVDGQIETWYYDYVPTLTNLPASDWTTDDEKESHIGDLFFDKSTGYSYRFFNDNGTYEWVLIQDTDITTALATASTAQDTADAKKRVFTTTPTPPYDVGDLWTDGIDIKTCMTARASGATYVASDWVVLNEYANQDAVDAAQNAADAAQSAADSAQSAADTAAADAANAQSTADTAKANAATAQTTANSAASAAADAQSAADDAQAAADAAQAAADAVATRTTTLETELSVVQGQISAIISETDITELQNGNMTLYDLYTSINATVNGITSTVGEIQTEVTDNYETLSSKITTIEETTSGITASVSSVQTQLNTLSEDTENALTEMNESNSEIYATKTDVTNEITESVGTTDGISEAENEVQDLLLDENGDALTVYEALIKVASYLTLTSNSFNIEFETITGDLTALTDGTIADLQSDSAAYSAKLSYVNITDEPAIVLGASDSDFKVKITTTEIDFMEGDSKVAWISNQQLHITEAETSIVNVSSKLTFWDTFTWLNINGALVLVKEGYEEVTYDSEGSDDE